MTISDSILDCCLSPLVADTIAGNSVEYRNSNGANKESTTRKKKGRQTNVNQRGRVFVGEREQAGRQMLCILIACLSLVVVVYFLPDVV